ncbi:hypothetical protein PG984_001221 [Apiospora sp. TS-2023a]
MSPSKKSKSKPTPVKTETPPPQYRVLPEASNVMTTTLSELPGYKIIRTIGAVYGWSYTSSYLGMFASDSSIFKDMYSCNNDALARIIIETQTRGGNAVIRLRHSHYHEPPYNKMMFIGTAAVVEKL